MLNRIIQRFFFSDILKETLSNASFIPLSTSNENKPDIQINRMDAGDFDPTGEEFAVKLSSFFCA